MTNEFISRITSILLNYEIEFVVTGGVSQIIRKLKKSTMDLDVVIKVDKKNIDRISKIGNEFNVSGNKISESIEKGEIVRLKLFPFNVDFLPKLDGVKSENIFENKEMIEFDNLKIPLISKSDLEKNYRALNVKTNGQIY